MVIPCKGPFDQLPDEHVTRTERRRSQRSGLLWFWSVGALRDPGFRRVVFLFLSWCSLLGGFEGKPTAKLLGPADPHFASKVRRASVWESIFSTGFCLVPGEAFDQLLLAAWVQKGPSSLVRGSICLKALGFLNGLLTGLLFPSMGTRRKRPTQHFSRLKTRVSTYLSFVR